MRIPVNLASEPFRRDRPMIVASSVVGVLLTVLLGMLVYLAMSERDRASEARATLERMQRQMDSVAQEEGRLQAVVRRPGNAEVLDRSIFLNELLHRKGVSWTRIFADLEEVTPHNVRLMSVRPQISAENQLTLDMWVASQSTEPVVTFVMQLEQSPLFGATTVSTSLPPTQNEPLYRYRVSVKYAQKL
jgi:type IV pilus assembly protein PilN